MPDEGIGRDAETVGSKQPRRPFTLAAQALWAVDDSEKEVVGDGELAHQQVVLIDNGEAELARLQRVGGRERLAHDRHAALVGGTAPPAMPRSVLLPEPFSPRTA